MNSISNVYKNLCYNINTHDETADFDICHSAYSLLHKALLVLKKGRAEIQARCERHTGGGVGRSAVLGGGVNSLPVLSGECKLLGLEEINMFRRENFFLALSKVLIILLSESTVVSAEGGVTGTSGLERGYSVFDWSLWSEAPSSVVCFSTDGNSPGALHGLVVKSPYVGSSPLSALTFDALTDLNGSSKAFFLTLVCGKASFPNSGSGLYSLLNGVSVF